MFLFFASVLKDAGVREHGRRIVHVHSKNMVLNPETNSRSSDDDDEHRGAPFSNKSSKCDDDGGGKVQRQEIPQCRQYAFANSIGSTAASTTTTQKQCALGGMVYFLFFVFF